MERNSPGIVFPKNKMPTELQITNYLAGTPAFEDDNNETNILCLLYILNILWNAR